ncbi:hypothetical protein SAMN05444365_103333 [Micromonospora pattaloongensis]|uniref:DUF4190 domain-containing protein n=1 Tax=Micromonospora pattaloongensis TaxID=405436 RepID=A0A1H3MF95_9ACTN|nr:hypothetical protein [Micromonospora pattaloongensis]SDY74675.1 hypothetical protein SAMN05444365_103333 [Micromonospora pattaloongensis]
MSAPFPPPAAAPGNDHTRLWGVLGIVVGMLCCGILGVIFGVLSIQNAKRCGRSPTLGWIAVVLSALNIVASAVLAATGRYPGR